MPKFFKFLECVYVPNLFIFSLISSNFRANVVCSGKHRPFSYELCHFARHFSLEKFRLVENRLNGIKRLTIMPLVSGISSSTNQITARYG